MSTVTGKTRTPLKLRAGPGTEHTILRFLVANTPLEVVDREEEWLKVQVIGEDGFVHSKFVVLDDQEVFEGLFRSETEEGPSDALEGVPLEPSEAKTITLGPEATDQQKGISKTWNRFGGLLTFLANELKIEPAAAIAVLYIESGGRGFSGGRMIIRFENHIFRHYWGRHHQSKFRDHFKFDEEKPWINQFWRPSSSGSWRRVHKRSQDSEWKVFEFARTLSDADAKLSISMGAPQIMGFNYGRIGFESVREMFDAFSKSERDQIVGLFDFVKGPSSVSEMVLALQEGDYIRFAEGYNGLGQATKYGGLMQGVFEQFNQLVEGGS